LTYNIAGRGLSTEYSYNIGRGLGRRSVEARNLEANSRRETEQRADDVGYTPAGEQEAVVAADLALADAGL
jgi:hypothetical protein